MSGTPEPTPPTTLYSQDELEAALAAGISSQALWLLISLERYGWRTEFDMIGRLLRPADDQSPHADAHARLLAYGWLFLGVDKLWRLTAGVKAFRAGGEFLNETDGYLRHGGTLAESLDWLAAITEAEWAEIVKVPDAPTILRVLTDRSASGARVVEMTAFAEQLPAQLCRFAQELRDVTFAKSAAQSSARATTFDMRELDNRLRHGAPVIYHECSPTDAGWRPVVNGDSDIDETVGIIMAPPPAGGGTAYITLFKTGAEMDRGLMADAVKFGGVLRRIAAGVLADLGLGDPLAALADIPDPRSE